jgi:hypothetical protein
VAATLGPSSLKESSEGNIQVTEVRQRVKNPQLEAWKRGTVPELEPQTEVATAGKKDTKEADDAIGTAM